MSDKITFFVPYHTGYAHAELVRSFSSYTDVHLFIYKWNPARQRIQEHFSTENRIFCHEFSLDNILAEINNKNHRRVVFLLTASTNYLFGQLQLRLFRILQQYIPSIIDVYPIGHCMYGCQSCAYAYTHCLPITFTNYIRTKDDKVQFERDFEILVCPSYSFQGAPFSFLSNEKIVQYLLTLKHSHAIKLHPLALESDRHPFLSLTDLERQHVQKLSESVNVLRNNQISTLKLLEHARVIICDSNSSIPFEALYFQDKKYVFVYETENEYDEQDDRQNYFHKFQTAEQLNDLIEKYVHQQLESKTENSHEFFLEKYDEPTGNEIEQLADVRQWTKIDEEESTGENFDKDEVKQAVQEDFKSILTPMALYVLGDHTMFQVTELFFKDDQQLFDTMQNNVDEL
ncbi:unnamed protein product [Adineta ricciae]|uniref:Uncharacterized protein n=1 Tax=Adineta ricciae TaxID=249248 RepID=A0A815PX66_ADIRI|nr:unnamed protein product [Adineta ricciae]